MTFNTRTPARAGATALLATGVLAAFAAPAFAAVGDTDLGIKVVGNTIAGKAQEKAGTITLKNLGTNDADKIELKVDVSKLQTNKVTLAGIGGDAPGKGCAPGATAAIYVCDVLPQGGVIKAGKEDKLNFWLKPAAGATNVAGSVGSITFEVSHGGKDDKLGNNRADVDVKVGDSGPDMALEALDVPVGEDGKVGALAPGETGLLFIATGNQGDVSAKNIKVTADLPKGATFDTAIVKQFPKKFPPCVFEGTNAVCELKGLTLVPAQDDNNSTDKVYSGIEFALPVKVDAKAKGGVNLKGGLAKVAAEAVVVSSVQRAPQAPPVVLPDGIEGVQAKKVTNEVDPTDNQDDFIVVVKKGAVVASPSPAPGQGAGGPSLPVTGVQAGLIGGTGLAVLLAGAVMFFLARRRRVVMVAPRDEKLPTA